MFCMLSRSMSSDVITDTVPGTASIGRAVRVAAVVTASSCVGCAGVWAGVWVGAVWASAGSASVLPSAVVAASERKSELSFI